MLIPLMRIGNKMKLETARQTTTRIALRGRVRRGLRPMTTLCTQPGSREFSPGLPLMDVSLI
jgi:hypothetical protein